MRFLDDIWVIFVPTCAKMVHTLQRIIVNHCHPEEVEEFPGWPNTDVTIIHYSLRELLCPMPMVYAIKRYLFLTQNDYPIVLVLRKIKRKDIVMCKYTVHCAVDSVLFVHWPLYLFKHLNQTAMKTNSAFSMWNKLQKENLTSHSKFCKEFSTWAFNLYPHNISRWP